MEESGGGSPGVGTKDKRSLGPDLEKWSLLPIASSKLHVTGSLDSEQEKTGSPLDFTGKNYNTPLKKKFPITTGSLKLIKVLEWLPDK